MISKQSQNLLHSVKMERVSKLPHNDCIYAIKRLNYKDESDTNMLFVAIRVLYSILFNMEK